MSDAPTSTTLVCAHCGGPHPEREDPDNSLCSAYCVVVSGGYMEGCGTAEVVEMFSQDMKDRIEAAHGDEAEDEDDAWARGIAHLLNWLVRAPTIEDYGRTGPLIAALNVFLAAAK